MLSWVLTPALEGDGLCEVYVVKDEGPLEKRWYDYMRKAGSGSTVWGILRRMKSTLL
jgi:hypothetical protein